MDEYISRELMLKNLTHDLEHHSDEGDPLTKLIMQRFIKYVKDFPAADVQPVKHGRWIINSDGYYPQCSECMSEPQGRAMTDFCPNCGAKMDGGDG